MKPFKTDEGKWYVESEAGVVVAGPFEDEAEALAWIAFTAARTIGKR